ncbi:MAG: hypothetical protein ABJE10_08870 [bacterium]
MLTELRFVCALLATWRVTHLLTAEDGPFDVIVLLRARLGDNVVGRAMDCFYCSSLWVAAPLALFVATDPLGWFVAWLAVSGGACLVERLTDRPHTRSETDRASREGEPHELLWRTPPSVEIDDSTPISSDARIAGSIGIDVPWIPR